jgi:rhamnogalacturonan endolyase
MVYDLDGDGRAELACKTADGTKDGTGKIIGDATKDWRNKEERSQKYGRILTGPEFLTIFDGKTGAALKTVDYLPGRDPIDGWGGIGGNGKNDSYGNRCDRFLACVAYLDGQHPSLVMCRGVYGRIVMAAWDWRGGELKSRWVFDSGIGKEPFEPGKNSPFSGMGGHALSVADVDADGKDEILYQAMTVDDNGQGLYSTGRRHGDAIQVSDFDPARPGLELYLVTENEEETVRFQTPGAGLHDAQTGKPLWTHSPGVDISDGSVADIDPRHPGAEVWGGPGGLRTVKGEEIGPKPRFSDWVIWWDGDLLREIYGGFGIYKWQYEAGREEKIYDGAPDAGGGPVGRLAGGTPPARAGRQVPAAAHHHDPDRAPPGDLDAGPAVPALRRVAECFLQQAAAPVLLPRARDGHREEGGGEGGVREAIGECHYYPDSSKGGVPDYFEGEERVAARPLLESPCTPDPPCQLPS